MNNKMLSQSIADTILSMITIEKRFTAGGGKGNHLPLLFRKLHTAGNGENVQPSAEYHEPPHTQCLADVAGGNGGILTWGILDLYHMKQS